MRVVHNTVRLLLYEAITQGCRPWVLRGRNGGRTNSPSYVSYCVYFSYNRRRKNTCWKICNLFDKFDILPSPRFEIYVLVADESCIFFEQICWWSCSFLAVGYVFSCRVFSKIFLIDILTDKCIRTVVKI